MIMANIEKINGRSMLDITDLLEGKRRCMMILDKDIVIMDYAYFSKIRYNITEDEVEDEN